MDDSTAGILKDMGNITVHYWASAKQAAGIAGEQVDATTLAELLDEIDRRHGSQGRFRDVIGTCSIRMCPVSSRPPSHLFLLAY